MFFVYLTLQDIVVTSKAHSRFIERRVLTQFSCQTNLCYVLAQLN